MIYPIACAVLVALVSSCDSPDVIVRAESEDEATHNCDIIQSLSDDLCTPDDPMFSAICTQTKRPFFGPGDATSHGTDCETLTCRSALRVAEIQCEESSRGLFVVQPPPPLTTAKLSGRMLVALALLTSCSSEPTVRKATEVEHAIQNCEVLQALSDEVCGPDDEVFAAECLYGFSHPIGLTAPPAPGTDCSTLTCQRALDVAQAQCEAHLGADFELILRPESELDTCCAGLEPGCHVGVVCL
ncbi:MAG: hypothetical protein H6741_32300 [Alphaproteobacteria bacterium]|nr:hypothetical protein [Alphaproteobacteria bacterium]